MCAHSWGCGSGHSLTQPHRPEGYWPDAISICAYLCDFALNDVLCDNGQDFHVLGANKCQIVFVRTLSISQLFFMSIDFNLFCLIVSFKIPNTVELSVRRGVGGCMWPNSASVTLSGAPLWALWKHASTSDSAAEATTFSMTEATLRMDPFSVSC
jgi:hypothetical protein